MSLDKDLIYEFIKITNDSKETKKESTVYGTVKEYAGSLYVQFDGAELLTPVSNATNIADGERVLVMVKNHSAVVTGNLTSPSARWVEMEDEDGSKKMTVEGMDPTKISEFEIIIADKVSTGDLTAANARIDELLAENVDIKEQLEAKDAVIGELQTGNVVVEEKLTVNEADISSLKTDKLDVSVAEATYATIENLEATNLDVENLEATYGEFVQVTTETIDAINASISNLDADKLSAEEARFTYANIDFSNIDSAAMEYFYANSGLIENVIVADGSITGRLVGVTIVGDLIEAGTLVADKLVIQGEDGLYYKLNTDGVTTEAEQTEYNSLNGQIILAKSITATQISVSDLIAFDATIGGFTITENSIHSEVKDSEGNTTRGIYMDTDGQFNFGDETNFVKYYRDEDGTYRLAISADSILYALNGKQYSVADLGQIGEYVHIGTYEGEPCIELGESDSDFKLIITNTRIMFMEGSSIPAYINNQSLHITKAVIEEEIQQGQFVWKVRQNGNLGLMWKGAEG